MNVHPVTQHRNMPASIQKLLSFYDRKNAIVPYQYIDLKVRMLNEYMREHKLSACVVGVSGGIDSALVLALAVHAYTQPNSPIEHIYGVFMPSNHTVGATGQAEARLRVQELSQALVTPIYEVAVDQALTSILVGIDSAECDLPLTPWARGQAVANTRTPILYSVANLSTANGRPAVVLGTTNLDEGAYLGYVGKAADGMVDLQLISDLRKHQVREIAQVMDVPASILNVEPTGDMFDGRTDEQVFGASYEYARLYQYLLLDPCHQERLRDLPEGDANILKAACDNIESLHRYNSHKYITGAPSVYLDIFSTNIQGGWNHTPVDAQVAGLGISHDQPITLPVQRAMEELVHTRPQRRAARLICSGEEGVCHTIDNALPMSFVNHLLHLEATSPTALRYYTDNHGQPVPPSHRGETGSRRSSIKSRELAAVVYEALLHAGMPRIKLTADGAAWRLVGANPYARLMQYQEGAGLHAHRDGNYHHDTNGNVQNLMSVVIYLTTGTSGCTRFIRDCATAELVGGTGPTANDWKHEATNSDVDFRVEPCKGRIAVFDTHLLHDSQVVVGDPKIVMLTELVYERIVVPNSKSTWRELSW